MAERIYVRDAEGGLEPLAEEPFSTENALQRLLAEHPELLDGEQMRPGAPRRWILVTREQGIPDTAGAAARWSLDHLVIDQDATPTLVEVKRGANSEVRRNVVGQMLDYAARAPQVSADELRRTFEDRPDAEERLAHLLGDEEPDADEFWEDVARNLAAKRLRLLFVADSIPDELRRVVEFLNEQMRDVEVLAVEIKQFCGKGESTTQTFVPRVVVPATPKQALLGKGESTTQTFVPRVIGRLAAPPGRSTSGRRRKKLTRELLLNEIGDDRVCAAVTRLLDVAEKNKAHLDWGLASVAIQAVSADESRQTVARIYRPEASYWGAREFAFGFHTVGEGTPGALRSFLETWTHQFENDDFAELAPMKPREVWNVSYGDAVRNIDLLAERLQTVLTEIGKL